MSDLPSNLKYTESHEWIRSEDDGSLTIGITDHAQDALGDMVFIDLPEDGDDIEVGADCVVLESVKAASDVYAPTSGVVTSINEALEDAPELTNSSPYDEGWLFTMTPAADADLSHLLDADAYQEIIDADDH